MLFKDIKSSIKISNLLPELIKQAQDDVIHLDALYKGAAEADTGDTVILTGLSEKEKRFALFGR